MIYKGVLSINMADDEFWNDCHLPSSSQAVLFNSFREKGKEENIKNLIEIRAGRYIIVIYHTFAP